MSAKRPTLHERIQVRAYYLHQNHFHDNSSSADAIWLTAEAVEIALSEKRSEASKKAAATRKFNKGFSIFADQVQRDAEGNKIKTGIIH